MVVVWTRSAKKKQTQPETWESHVLPHGPLRNLSNRLWVLEGSWHGSGPPVRNMVIYKTSSNAVIVHNAIAVDEVTVSHILQEVGKPDYIIVPNGMHRADCAVWKARFPEAKIVYPAGARKKIEELVRTDVEGQELAGLFEDVRAQGIPGVDSKEGAWEYFFEFQLSDGTWAIVCADALFNLQKSGKFFSDLIGSAFGSFGGPGGVLPVISRLSRWFFVKDKAAASAFYRALGARSDLGPLIVGHGSVVPAGSVAAAFQNIAASIS